MSESPTAPTAPADPPSGIAPGSMIPVTPEGHAAIMGGGAAGADPVIEIREKTPRFWNEPFFAWMLSAAFHLALIIAAALIFVAARKAMLQDDQQQIVIPNSFTDPSLSPGGPDMRQTAGSSEDPGKIAQDRLHDLLRSEGWAQAAGTENPSSFLEGADAGKDPFVIARGGGGSVGDAGADSTGQGGNLAPYGSVGGGGGGGAPNTSFYGTGGAAKRIVYILDHSGSMISNFDFLQREATRSVRNLVPIQFFSVIMVSETAETVGGNELQRATPTVKEQFASKILDFRAEGQNDDLLPPFQDAFQRAFAMKPELIYFLTDGHFDPALIDVIDRLNKDHKVRINTIAFVAHDPSYEQQLQDLAKRNGGVYKFVAAKDLGQ